MKTLLAKKKLVFLTLLLLIFTGLGISIPYWLQHPQHNKSTIVLIEKGSSLTHIANFLHHEKVLNFPFLFKAFLYGTHSWKDLKAGEYLIPADISPAHLIHILKKGEVILHPITVVEGATSYEITQKLLSDPRFIGQCSLPAEGSILPETYHFPRGTSRSAIILHMQQVMKECLAKLWAQRSPNLLLRTPEEGVILASIIEKETSLPSERAMVAAVFINRLTQSMPLQADPTVLYALTEGKSPLGRELTRKDLTLQSPYNTYLHQGLPPTPIANPGLSSLKAVFHPAAVSYLYFVANGDGGHNFATHLQDHQKNHAQWRQLKNVTSQ